MRTQNFSLRWQVVGFGCGHFECVWYRCQLRFIPFQFQMVEPVRWITPATQRVFSSEKFQQPFARRRLRTVRVVLGDVSSNSRSHLANSCFQVGMSGCCVYTTIQRENTSQAICNYSHVRFSMTFLSTRIPVPFCFNQPCRHAQSRWVFPIIQVTLSSLRLLDSQAS